MKNCTHWSDDAVEQYSLGRMSSAESDRFEEHLLICPACQDRVETEDRITQNIRAALSQSPPVERSLPWWRWPALGMAVAAVAVLLAVWLRPATPVETVLMASRAEAVASVPANVPVHLTLAAPPSLGDARIEIVRSTGEVVWTGAARTEQPGRYKVAVNSLPAAKLLIRLYLAGSSEVAQEYALVVE